MSSSGQGKVVPNTWHYAWLEEVFTQHLLNEWVASSSAHSTSCGLMIQALNQPFCLLKGGTHPRINSHLCTQDYFWWILGDHMGLPGIWTWGECMQGQHPALCAIFPGPSVSLLLNPSSTELATCPWISHLLFLGSYKGHIVSTDHKVLRDHQMR